MSREIPMLFSAPMIVALLNGTKTETRRLVKPQPSFTGASGDSFEWHGGRKLLKLGYGAPYVHSNWTAVREAIEKCAVAQPGDILWCKETFCVQGGSVIYRATEPNQGCSDEEDMQPWTPSIFMRREYSRIRLLVKEVRCERLKSLNADAARAEGISIRDCLNWHAIADYAALWDSINKDYPWKSNPWIWVYRFERIANEQKEL
jgi:hypothetical protein